MAQQPLTPPPNTPLVLGDPRADFMWRQWLSQQFVRVYSSSQIAHNSLDALQGGTTGQYYHLTSSQHATVTSNSHNSLSGLQGGVAGQYYHLTSSEHALATSFAHNSLNGLQGGTAGQYYHLTQSQHNAVTSERFINLVATSTLTITSIPANRALYTATGGAVSSEAEYTYDQATNTLTVSSIVVSSYTGPSTGGSVASTFVVVDGFGDTLTYPIFVSSATGTEAALTHTSFNYNASTNTLNVGELVATSSGTFSALTVTSLTSGRVALIGGSGALTDNASFTYALAAGAYEVRLVRSVDDAGFIARNDGNDDAYFKATAVGAGVAYLQLSASSERWQVIAENNTSTLAIAGLAGNILRISSTAFYPATNDGVSLGVATSSFADLFLANGGVINWNNGGTTITQATENILFAGTTVSSFRFSQRVTPTANDGAALGEAGSLEWSDLFLAEGGVINWDNGDVRITQTQNTLAFSAATSYTFDSRVTASSTYPTSSFVALALANPGTTASTEVVIDFAPNAAGVGFRSAAIAAVNTDGANSTRLELRTGAGEAPVTRMTISETGRVAIGVSTSASAKLLLPAGEGAIAPLRISPGIAPSAPVDGDIWHASSGALGVYTRVNGVTVPMSDPWTYLKVSAAHFATSTTAFVNIPGLSFVPGTNSTYEFEATLMMKTSTAATNPLIGVRWPTGTTSVGWINQGQTNSTQLFTWGNQISTMQTGAGLLATTTAPWAVICGGLINAFGAAASSFGLQLASETNGVFVSTMIGSYLKYRVI